MTDKTNPGGDLKHAMGAGARRWSVPPPDFLIPFWAAATANLEAPEGTSRPLWRDLSSHQGTINANVMKLNGVHGVIMRAGISWGTPDPRFGEYMAACRSAEIKYLSSYHVIYTDQPIQDQIDLWFDVHPELDPDHPIPRVIDLEVDRGDSANHKADATWAMSEAVRVRDGIRPLIYSRRLLVNAWLTKWTQSQMDDHYWWLAQYLFNRAIEHPGPPTPPNRVSPGAVVLHQTADKKPGFPGEVQSAAVDWNRWTLGDPEQMDQFIAETWGGGVDPDPPPDPENLAARVSVLESDVKQLKADAHIHTGDHLF